MTVAAEPRQSSVWIFRFAARLGRGCRRGGCHRCSPQRSPAPAPHQKKQALAGPIFTISGTRDGVSESHGKACSSEARQATPQDDAASPGSDQGGGRRNTIEPSSVGERGRSRPSWAARERIDERRLIDALRASAGLRSNGDPGLRSARSPRRLRRWCWSLEPCRARIEGRGGVAQWQSRGLISPWSVVRIRPPLPIPRRSTSWRPRSAPACGRSPLPTTRRSSWRSPAAPTRWPCCTVPRASSTPGRAPGSSRSLTSTTGCAPRARTTPPS